MPLYYSSNVFINYILKNIIALSLYVCIIYKTWLWQHRKYILTIWNINIPYGTFFNSYYIMVQQGEDSSDGKSSISLAGDPGWNPGEAWLRSHQCKIVRGRDYQL